jgi:hypothetical protein
LNPSTVKKAEPRKGAACPRAPYAPQEGRGRTAAQEARRRGLARARTARTLPCPFRQDCHTARLMQSRCEIASNCAPSQGRSISLITRVNPLPGWGHAWTRKMTPSIPIFRNEINALGNFRGSILQANLQSRDAKGTIRQDLRRCPKDFCTRQDLRRCPNKKPRP